MRRTLRTALGMLVLAGILAAPALAFEPRAGDTVLVSESVDDDIYATGGTVDVTGTVNGDVVVAGGTLRLSGPATGNLGRLRYSTDQPPEIQPGAQVAASERVPVARGRPRLMLPGPRLPFAGRLLEWVWLLVLGIVLLAVAPVAGRRAVGRVGRHFSWSLLVGFLLLVAVPAAAVLAMASIIGIPLGIALLLLYLATLYPAQVIPATWLGDRLLGALTRSRPSPYLALLVGTLLLVILVALPFVGWLVRLLALLVGFGALWASVWIGRRP